MSAGEERFVQAITLKLKAGPASPGLPGSDSGTGGSESAAGGQHRGGGAPSNHGNVKWAPLSNTRRIGSGGKGDSHNPFVLTCSVILSYVLSLLAFSPAGCRVGSYVVTFIDCHICEPDRTRQITW